MDDMDRDTQAAEDTTTTAVDGSEQPTTTGATAARLLANPRRVRRA